MVSLTNVIYFKKDSGKKYRSFSLEKFENHDHWIYSYEKRQRLNLEAILHTYIPKPKVHYHYSWLNKVHFSHNYVCVCLLLAVDDGLNDMFWRILSITAEEVGYIGGWSSDTFYRNFSRWLEIFGIVLVTILKKL